jgi:hypothetical protein
MAFAVTSDCVSLFQMEIVTGVLGPVEHNDSARRQHLGAGRGDHP